MTQRFEKKIQNLFEKNGLDCVAFRVLEESALFFVHLEIMEGSETEVKLPSDTFMISCYKSNTTGGFQTLYCSGAAGISQACKSNFLTSGIHLCLVGHTSWFSSALHRLKHWKGKAQMGVRTLPYCDAQISKPMLITQAQLISEERLAEPKMMDVHGFAVLLLGEWETVQDLLRKIEVGRDQWLVSQAKRLMEQHIEGQPLSLETMAQSLAVSVSKLKIAFRQEAGASVYRYYLNLRLERAKSLLESHRYNVSEVAYRIGYNSVSKFSKMFAEYHGALPSQFSKSSLVAV
jgi:AraC-like DNA-binding protein